MLRMLGPRIVEQNTGRDERDHGGLPKEAGPAQEGVPLTRELLRLCRRTEWMT